jgi:hypothetical protein
MIVEPQEAGTASRTRWRADPLAAAVVLVWLVAAVSLAVMLLLGVGDSSRLGVARGALHLVYAVALVWYLARTGPSVASMPDSPLGRAWNGPLGRRVAGGLALAVVLMGLLDVGLFLLLLATTTITLLAIWWRQITRRAVLLGLGASVFAFLTGGLAFWRHGFVAKPMLIFMLVAIPPMFVAGGVLVTRTGLGAVRVLEGRYTTALRSVLTGAVLFLPLGLGNAAGPPRAGLGWVSAWWQPLVLPAWSAIAEEVAFRTLPVCLLYALIRPVLSRSPVVAVGFAVLFSAVTFGLGHGQTLGNLFNAGLGYGLPLAVVFARRDWEHAVGAHYTINMVPWLMALLRR